MSSFSYKNNILHVEDVSVEEIADQIATPFYCYSSVAIAKQFNSLKDALGDLAEKTDVCFAVKANSNLSVLKLLKNLGSGADTVSEGEIRRAVAVGIEPKKIVFSGVGKTRAEISYAIKIGIGQFNVESEAEIKILDEEAKKHNQIVDIALRVNPDVDAKTHEKISTGKKGDKFGIEWEKAIDTYKYAKNFNHLSVIGVSTHIGSQITTLDPFDKAFAKIAELVSGLRKIGINIKKVDLGGGLGVQYHEGQKVPDVVDYAAIIKKHIKNLDVELSLEPGRFITANAGILVSQVILNKKSGNKNYVVVDSAMNDLLRHSMYDAYHEVITVQKNKKEQMEEVEIVGPICETGDVLAKNRKLPKLKEGDLIAFKSAGAYGAVMSSTYNSRLLIPEILVKENKFAVIRKRQDFDDLLSLDNIIEF